MQLPRALFDLDADLVCLQELQDRRRQDWLFRTMRMNYPYAAGFAARMPFLRPGSTLMILSRFPLSEPRLHLFNSAPPDESRFITRGFLEAEVRFPALGELKVLNFHATAGGRGEHAQNPATERIRDQQISQMLERAAGHNRVLLLGDLNAGPQGSSANYRRLLEAGYVDVYGAAERPGVTWDPDNPLVAAGHSAPLGPRRVDHIFISRGLAAALGEPQAQVVLTERRVDTRQGWLPLSDHYGVRARFKKR